METIQDYLRRSELFSGLDSDSLCRILPRFQPVSFAKDSWIVREGDPGDTMYVITKGEVVVSRNIGWGQRELARMGEGNMFGEMALITHEVRTASVQAVTDVECVCMRLADFTELTDQDARFSRQVLRILTRRFSAADVKDTQEVLRAYRSVLFALAGLADSRDPDTGAHLLRTRNYCALLAEHLAKHVRYQQVVSPAFVESIYYVSPLHDIGKVAIPDDVLLKPARLTADEYAIMKKHSERGSECLLKVLEEDDTDLFRMAYRICRHHHEKWDGTGYPDGLKGEEIPLEARIMSLADVYDALLMKRVYKLPMSYAETRAELANGAGTFFDPYITEIMLEHIQEFETVHREFHES